MGGNIPLHCMFYFSFLSKKSKFLKIFTCIARFFILLGSLHIRHAWTVLIGAGFFCLFIAISDSMCDQGLYTWIIGSVNTSFTIIAQLKIIYFAHILGFGTFSMWRVATCLGESYHCAKLLELVEFSYKAKWLGNLTRGIWFRPFLDRLSQICPNLVRFAS